ncbi:MAG: glucosaminidase domain-containing protein, partial [Ignavibacteriota bacterium]
RDGYSPFGAVFIVAHAANESNWGKSAAAKQNNNLFGLMGAKGSSNLSTDHGTLAKFGEGSEDAYESYINRLRSAHEGAWSGSLDLYKKDNFTADELNQALHTGKYEGFPAYYTEGGGFSGDYGHKLVDVQMHAVLGRFISALEYLISENDSRIQKESRKLYQFSQYLNADQLKEMQTGVESIQKENENLRNTINELHSIESQVNQNFNNGTASTGAN